MTEEIEEVASVDVAEEEVAEEEKQVEGEVVAVPAAEAAADQVSGEVSTDELGVNTKLYFGNLPYSVDSAQLAGIIQDYASPELIEVSN